MTNQNKNFSGSKKRISFSHSTHILLFFLPRLLSPFVWSTWASKSQANVYSYVHGSIYVLVIFSLSHKVTFVTLYIILTSWCSVTNIKLKSVYIEDNFDFLLYLHIFTLFSFMYSKMFPSLFKNIMNLSRIRLWETLFINLNHMSIFQLFFLNPGPFSTSGIYWLGYWF